MRTLNGPRHYLRPLGGVESPLEIDRLARPQLGHQVEGLDRSVYPDAVAVPLAEPVELWLVPAGPDAEDRATPGKDVHGGHDLGQLSRRPEGDWRDNGAKLDR